MDSFRSRSHFEIIHRLETRRTRARSECKSHQSCRYQINCFGKEWSDHIRPLDICEMCMFSSFIFISFDCTALVTELHVICRLFDARTPANVHCAHPIRWRWNRRVAGWIASIATHWPRSDSVMDTIVVAVVIPWTWMKLMSPSNTSFTFKINLCSCCCRRWASTREKYTHTHKHKLWHRPTGMYAKTVQL